MESHICKNVTHVSQSYIRCRIIRLVKRLWACLCDGKGLQDSLVFVWRMFAPASATAGKQPSKRSLTHVDLCWCSGQSAATLPLPASPENSGVPSGRRVEAGAQARLPGFMLPQDSSQAAEMCLLPWLIPKLLKPREAREDVPLKEQPWQSCF